MVFSSPIFLYAFLPLTLALFAVVPLRLRTPLLFLLSLLFYAWSEGAFVYVLLVSISLNWLFALLLEWTASPFRRKLLVLAAVVLNIGALVYYKYCNFLVGNAAWLATRFHLGSIPLTKVHLPIGISFITFEALSYVIDVFRGHTRARRNPIEVGFYVSFFPHLIAGPILRFNDIAGPLAAPRVTAGQMESGIKRFIIGLAKKLLIANNAGRIADAVFGSPSANLSAHLAWVGVVGYALQIYFDFSGYSDMAIGLGRLFGFELPKNFDLPYSAQSIKEFWRRWHISLSTWFRDYLFIPLGGSRGSTLSSYRNLILVFLICGLWHGASWTFVFWGGFHGAFLILERTRFNQLLEASPRVVRQAYTLTAVMVGWVFFRADNFGEATGFLRAMVGKGLASSAATHMRFLELMDREAVLAFAIGIPLALLPVGDWYRSLTQPISRPAVRFATDLAGALVPLALLALCSLYLAAGTYNPFIYFRF